MTPLFCLSQRLERRQGRPLDETPCRTGTRRAACIRERISLFCSRNENCDPTPRRGGRRAVPAAAAPRPQHRATIGAPLNWAHVPAFAATLLFYHWTVRQRCSQGSLLVRLFRLLRRGVRSGGAPWSGFRVEGDGKEDAGADGWCSGRVGASAERKAGARSAGTRRRAGKQAATSWSRRQASKGSLTCGRHGGRSQGGWNRRVQNRALPAGRARQARATQGPLRLCRAGTRRSRRSTARHGTAQRRNRMAARR